MEPPRSNPTGPMNAPGAASPSPRGARLPAVDEHLVAPESHAEILDGRVYHTRGAHPPHATQHATAARVFGGALADGYTVAIDLLTRLDDDSDAAPDVTVFPTEPDAHTGGRQVEEIAFEVLDTERLAHATSKVEKLARRGVRRIFAVRVASRGVYEWDHAHHDWTRLDDDASIVDHCFRVPIPVAALVDRLLADDTIARALLASRNAVIEGALHEREARGRSLGETDTLASAVLRVLARRGVSVDERHRRLVVDCRDRTTLEAWLDRAATAVHSDEIFGADR